MFDIAAWRVFWIVLGFIGVGAALTFPPSRDVSDHYTFELVDREVKHGSGTTVLVRLVDERTGKVVPDATLFISRLDMSPHGMGAMEAPLEPLPDTLPGYYRFETDLSIRQPRTLLPKPFELASKVGSHPLGVSARKIPMAPATAPHSAAPVYMSVPATEPAPPVRQLSGLPL